MYKSSDLVLNWHKPMDIDILIQEHWQELLDLREEFLGYCLTTKRADREKLEYSIARMYEFAGLQPPKQVTWLSSPFEAVIATCLNELKHDEHLLSTGFHESNTFNKSITDSLPTEYQELRSRLMLPISIISWRPLAVESMTRDLSPLRRLIRVHPSVGEHPMLSGLDYNHLRGAIYGVLNREIWQIGENFIATNETVPTTVGEDWTSMSGKDRGDFLRTVWSMMAPTNARWLIASRHEHCPLMDAFPAAVLCALKLFGLDKELPPLIEAVRAGGWWWPMTNICFACDNPTELHLDGRRRLHNDREMAVCFEDGWGFWALDGVQVREAAVKNRLSLADIDGETNAEVRAVMINRFGLSKYMLESGAQEIHRDQFGVLYRKEMPRTLWGEAEPILMVQLVNKTPEPDGTFKTYFLRVPPEIQTTREAVAWTFAMNQQDYNPTQES